ncbi:hypothetical protein PIIN_10584 [Serendipita indica DSM 11827]|uniref:Uncharacterized protein n=1 Tax=Serendipita indica (strain DSM 11827) TaxID=1109443 RepID=G4TZ50_SERID|nr:hypothetical protein PIIN_10584 [Serendipita indica DSM 11827]
MASCGQGAFSSVFENTASGVEDRDICSDLIALTLFGRLLDGGGSIFVGHCQAAGPRKCLKFMVSGFHIWPSIACREAQDGWIAPSMRYPLPISCARSPPCSGGFHLEFVA